MRWLLLAFALGVLALQQQAELPATTRIAWAALPLAIALLALIVSLCTSAWRSRIARYVAVVSAAIAVGLGGFFYAGWRADVRLADQLPAAWQGQDIDLVGVIDDLPHAAPPGRA